MLAALWSADHALTAGDVQECLGSDLAYNTVLTILSRLHDKGLVYREKVGRAFSYRPSPAHAEMAARQMRTALERGSPDREAVLQRFVDSLSPTEGRVLGRLLRGKMR